jgi:hypothetical protein
MLSLSPDRDISGADAQLAGPLGDPWSIRLAGASSACPAIELYEAGELVDVISATAIARPLLLGARTSTGRGGPRAIAWGRVPATGELPSVGFARRPWRGPWTPATVLLPVDWCWLAVADGGFAGVLLRTAGGRVRRRLAAGAPCC